MNHEQLQAAIACAQQEAASGELHEVPHGFGPRPTTGYKAGRFDIEGESWVVCTAPMISSSFQLLDAAVRQRIEAKAPYAVALLGARPEKDGHGSEPSDDYLRKYQQVAWSALGVAWVLHAGSHQGQFLADPTTADVERGTSFNTLVERIEKKLAALHISPRPNGSRAAEEIIRPCVQEALQEVDPSFRPEPVRRYSGFWRRPETDGLWQRAVGIPATFALEVKLDEDMNNPLCQAVEPLGRLRRDGLRTAHTTEPETPSARARGRSKAHAPGRRTHEVHQRANRVIPNRASVLAYAS